MKNIGEQLRAFFKEKGMTQEEIADRLGVSQQYVNALLNGKTAFGKKQARKWNELFGISVNWLLTGDGDISSGGVIQNNSGGDNINGGSVTVGSPDAADYLYIIKRQSEQFSKSQEQIDRLLSIIENIPKPLEK